MATWFEQLAQHPGTAKEYTVVRYLWGKSTGVFKPLRVIICPYSEAPDDPIDVACEMMSFTSLSPWQAARSTHFRRHEIDFDFTADGPDDDDNANADGDDDEFDDAIMERLTHANMPMHAHFDAA